MRKIRVLLLVILIGINELPIGSVFAETVENNHAVAATSHNEDEISETEFSSSDNSETIEILELNGVQDYTTKAQKSSEETKCDEDSLEIQSEDINEADSQELDSDSIEEIENKNQEKQDVSGVWGTSEWRIENNVLFFGSGEFEAEAIPELERIKDSILKIVFEDDVKLNPKSGYLFEGFSKTQEIVGFENVDSSEVVDMTKMFRSMSELSYIDVSHFDTRKVTNYSYMFSSMKNLKKLDVSNFNTGSAVLMNSMFADLENLTELDITNFNTSNVSDMEGMFEGMKKLQSIDVSSFDTSNLTNAFRMFSKMESIKELDLSHFNTEKLSSMTAMFLGNISLEELDLSNFVTDNVTGMSETFRGLSRLEKLDISNFSTENTVNMNFMFSESDNLSSLKLGPDFKFISGTSGLVSPPNDYPYAGKWRLEGTTEPVYTSEQLAEAYPENTGGPGVYVWDEVPEIIYGEPVTVKYVDEYGKELAESIVLEGVLGKKYKATSKKIDEYELYVTPINESGVFKKEKQTVLYTYKKPFRIRVTAYFLDEFGKELEKEKHYSGYLGDSYDLSEDIAVIEGYSLKQIPNNIKGTMPVDVEKVEFIYVENHSPSIEITNYTLRYSVNLDEDYTMARPKAGESVKLSIHDFSEPGYQVQVSRLDMGEKNEFKANKLFFSEINSFITDVPKVLSKSGNQNDLIYQLDESLVFKSLSLSDLISINDGQNTMNILWEITTDASKQIDMESL